MKAQGTQGQGRFLWRDLSKERRAFLLGLAAGLVAGLATVGLMAVGGALLAFTTLSGIATAGAWSPVVGKLSAGIRFFAVLRTLGRYGERVWIHDATLRVLARLRVRFFTALLPHTPPRSQPVRTGDLLHQLVADIDALGAYGVQVLAPHVWGVALSVAMAAIFLVWDVRLGLALGGILFLGVLALPRLGGALSEDLPRRIAEEGRALRVRLVGALSGRLELEVYRQLAPERQRLLAVSRRTIALQEGLAWRVAAMRGLGVLWQGLGLMAAFLLGAGALQRGAISPEHFVAVLLAMMTAMEVLSPGILSFPERARVRAATERLAGLLEARASTPPPARTAAPPETFDLSLTEVTLRYPGATAPALSDVTLVVPQGQRLALLGPSGAGKTSLVNALLRFVDPESGQVTLGGVDLRELSEADLRRGVTAVPGRPHLFGGTLRDNLRLARPEATDEELWEALAGAQLSREVSTWPEGLDTWLLGSGGAVARGEIEGNWPQESSEGAAPARPGPLWGGLLPQLGSSLKGASASALGRPLSGGEARRVALARALLREAPVVILDEPTADLDSDTAHRVISAFLDATAGRTLIVVTHDRRVAARMDRALTLRAGRLVTD